MPLWRAIRPLPVSCLGRYVRPYVPGSIAKQGGLQLCELHCEQLSGMSVIARANIYFYALCHANECIRPGIVDINKKLSSFSSFIRIYFVTLQFGIIYN